VGSIQETLLRLPTTGIRLPKMSHQEEL
jgi:hypothetical protein